MKQGLLGARVEAPLPTRMAAVEFLDEMAHEPADSESPRGRLQPAMAD